MKDIDGFENIWNCLPTEKTEMVMLPLINPTIQNWQ
jgi:hypothetical protein